MKNELIFKYSEIEKLKGLKKEIALNGKDFHNAFIFPVKIKELKTNILFSCGSNSIFLEAALQGKLILSCAICLKEFEYALKEEFNQAYNSSEEIIDLKPLISEVLTLAEPLKPICSEKCKNYNSNNYKETMGVKIFNIKI